MSVIDDHVKIFDAQSKFKSTSQITVIISLYNYSLFIEQTLNSVLNQTLSSLSLLVVNDASTDESEFVVEKWMKMYSDRFERCTLYSNKMNYGLATTRNNGLSHVETEFCFILDADNLLYPSAIEKLLTACRTAQADAAFCQLELFGESWDVGSANVLDRDRLKSGNYIDAMAVFRTDSLIACGGYGLFETAGWEDYDLWCTFVDRGLTAVFLPEILCRYRVHQASMLRAETNIEIANIELEITTRHPWLELDR